MSTPTQVPEALSAAARHALRTPLNHIIGYAEVLLEEGASPEAADTLRGIVSRAQRICDFVQGMSPTDPEGELDRLRSTVAEDVRDLDEQAALLEEGTEKKRILAAVDTLVHFVSTGALIDNSAEQVPRRSVLRPYPGRTQGRLLVVDDNEANRDVLTRHLTLQGYDVEQARSGHDALAVATQSNFDAVLLDLLMPDMDGFEVLSRLKKCPGLQGLPVLVISASDALDAVAEAIQRGAEDYLFKPFDPVLLNARLSAAIERSRLRNEERRRRAELEALTADLQRSNQDLQRFAYAASHDLEAPLRTILSYLTLLKRRMGERMKDDEREMIGFTEGAARRMHELIRDLLAYSRASTEKVELRPVSIPELLRELVEDMLVQITEAQAEVTWDESVPVILADPVALRQILQNLVGNAIKYRRAEEAPCIYVGMQELDDSWRFCVRDNGEGIPPQYRSQIFEMFQRLHGDDCPGSGIGLAICKRLVERLGGSIWVESAPVHGSEFYFTIAKAD